MAKLRIPESYRPGLAAILTLDDHAGETLVTTLEDAPTPLTSTDLSARLKSRLSNTPPDKIEDIVHTLFSLYSLQAHLESSASDLVDDVCDAMDVIGSPDLKLASDTSARFKMTLVRLLSAESLTRGLKTLELHRPHRLIARQPDDEGLRFRSTASAAGIIESTHERRRPVESEWVIRWKAPVARVDPDVERTFRALAECWRQNTAFSSSLQTKVLDRAYQEIIGKGRDVLPLLLREMRDDPDHWFWALRAIVGKDVARPNATFDEAVEDWLAWGRREGLLPD